MTTRRVLAAAVTAAALALAARLLFTHPSAVRDWAPEQAHPAHARVAGHTAELSGIRNFSYDSAGHATPGYYDASFDLDSIETAWFVLTTFSHRWRAPAHTFVSFGFAGGRYVAISVEARREVGESYGIVAGLLNSFELVYIIGDERDLIGHRAAVEGDDTYLYPVRAPREKIRAMFVDMLARANRVQDDPEFYNSLFNSCASNLVRHVNRVVPGRIPAGIKLLLPGYADEVAESLGLIDSTGGIATIRRRYQVNARAREAIGSPDFSTRIRRS